MTNEDSKFTVLDKIQALDDHVDIGKVYRGDLTVILCELCEI